MKNFRFCTVLLLLLAAAAVVIFTSCETMGGQAGGGASGEGAFPAGSPEDVAFQRLQKSGKDGGVGLSVAASGDGSVWLRSSPYTLLPGGKDFIGMAALFESGKEKASALFFDENSANLLFGASCALSPDGSLAVFGAPETSPGGTGYIFGYLRHPDGSYPLWFRIPAQGKGWLWGMDVDVSGGGGKTVVIGAPGEDGHGRVHYFLAPEGGWPEADDSNIRKGYLGAGGAQPGDEFGRSVAVSKDDSTIIVGSPGKNGGQGIVYLFTKPAEGWLHTRDLVPLDLADAQGDRFGQSVAVSGDGAVIAAGAPGAADGAGGVYIITIPKDGGEPKFVFFPAENDRGMGISVDVSADGKTVAAGGYGREYSGTLKVYRSESGNWDDSKQIADWFGDPAKPEQKGAMLGYSFELVDDGSKLFGGIPFYKDGGGTAMWFNIEE